VTVPENELAKLFGKNGHELAKRAKGIDTRAVVTARAAKSFSQETTYARDVRDEKVLLRTLQRQADQIARQLQRKELTATTVRIKLRWPDFTTLTRQTTLNQPTSDDALIAQLAERLFRKVWRPGKAVRLLGVGVSGLSSPPQQLSLWDQKEADRREE
ncbi:MAG: DNA polymerase IV, partial [Gammaproteobacteria bacterium]|nr:DNA polymerase IV [Gammaproteobacteria bacterium]